MPTPDSRRIVPDNRLRDTLIAFGAGAVILGIILYAVFNFSQQTSANARIEGVIVSKHFTPQPETQISVGQNGLNSRQIDGEYSFEVRRPQESDKVYRVIVGKQDYESHQIGEPFSFYRE